MKRRSAPLYGPYGSGRTLRFFYVLRAHYIKIVTSDERLCYRIRYCVIAVIIFFKVICKQLWSRVLVRFITVLCGHRSSVGCGSVIQWTRQSWMSVVSVVIWSPPSYYCLHRCSKRSTCTRAVRYGVGCSTSAGFRNGHLLPHIPQSLASWQGVGAIASPQIKFGLSDDLSSSWKIFFQNTTFGPGNPHLWEISGIIVILGAHNLLCRKTATSCPTRQLF